ncbi:MAG: hypothetical protein ABI306_11430 [Caulobacteraceae bacterium]
MKYALLPLMAVAMAGVASAASAEVSGRWRVAGKVSSFAFTLTCDFRRDGDRLGGVCVDASTNNPKVNAGKSHVLTAGSITGDKISWTYRSSFLFSKFDVTFKGIQTGNRMSGTISAQGHDGTFTAARQ